jgi:hypothetical protein
MLGILCPVNESAFTQKFPSLADELIGTVQVGRDVAGEHGSPLGLQSIEYP